MGYTTDRERQLREARLHGRWSTIRSLVAKGVGANLKKTPKKKAAKKSTAKKAAAKKTTSAPQTSSASNNT